MTILLSACKCRYIVFIESRSTPFTIEAGNPTDAYLLFADFFTPPTGVPSIHTLRLCEARRKVLIKRQVAEARSLSCELTVAA